MLKHSVEYRTAWSERWNQDQCQNNDSDISTKSNTFVCAKMHIIQSLTSRIMMLQAIGHRFYDVSSDYQDLFHKYEGSFKD